MTDQEYALAKEKLMIAANDAEDVYSLNELEEYTEEQKDKQRNVIENS